MEGKEPRPRLTIHVERSSLGNDYPGATSRHPAHLQYERQPGHPTVIFIFIHNHNL